MSKEKGSLSLDASIHFELNKYRAGLNQTLVFSTKNISFLGRKVTILLQNENGPCPLLAIANCLLLENRISVSDQPYVSLSILTSIIADAILSRPSTKPDEAQQHVQLDSVLNCLPKLATGLDLNIGFSHVKDMEFTSELSVFDALGIDVFHGWCLDPQDKETSSVISDMRINKLYDELVRLASTRDVMKTAKSEVLLAERAKLDALNDDGVSSNEPIKLSEMSAKTELKIDSKEILGSSTVNVGSDELEGVSKQPDCLQDTGNDTSKIEDFRSETIIKAFLDASSSQMTYFGLTSLHSEIKERQLAVLYRNGHFNTVFKYIGVLHTLVSDEGYRSEAKIVWEKLLSIDGDTDYVGADFYAETSPSIPAEVLVPTLVAGTYAIDTHALGDHDLALTLQREEELHAQELAIRNAQSNIPESRYRSEFHGREHHRRDPNTSSERRRSSCAIS